MEQLVKLLIVLVAIALVISAVTDPIKAAATLIMILLVLYGCWHVVDPEGAFMFGSRWLFKYAEPSDIALILTKIEGMVIIIASIIV